MSAELAIAISVKPYGMRVIYEVDFDSETMIDVTADVAASGTIVELGTKIVIPIHT